MELEVVIPLPHISGSLGGKRSKGHNNSSQKTCESKYKVSFIADNQEYQDFWSNTYENILHFKGIDYYPH